MPIDLWGWQTTPDYQRPSPVGPEYVKRRAVDESYKHGANLVEVYRGGFPLTEVPDWTAEATTDFVRHAHARGMCVQWFPHYHGGAPLQPVGHWQKSVDALTALARCHCDSLTLPLDTLIDAMGSEAWNSMTPLLYNLCMWPWAPHASFYTVHRRYTETLPNELECAASAGFGVDDQMTRPPWMPMLVEHFFQLDEKITKRHGFQFWASQAERRTVDAAYGGVGHPDWILKQVNDQFRPHFHSHGQEMYSPTAMWWINEAEEDAGFNRRYVYGISQDPVRCAVAARFSTTGMNGAASKGRRIEPRVPYSAKDAFLQNNYMRLVVRHDQNAMELWCDPERTAHYDNNSFAFRILAPFAATCLSESGARVEQQGETGVVFLEPAGFTASLQSRHALRAEGIAFEEERTFTMRSDSPWLRASIAWKSRGTALPGIGVELHAPHYDILSTDASHPKAAKLPPTQIITLRDSTGMCPEIVIMLSHPNAVRLMKWTPKGSLRIVPEKPGLDPLELAIALPDGLYNQEDLPDLHRFTFQPAPRLELNAEGTAEVCNPLPIPVTQVVRIAGGSRLPGPYHVFEYGEYVFRGAQPSVQQEGDDYLKVYLPAQGHARVFRDDFIENAARPGWGCQYTLTLSKVQRTSTGARVEVHVKNVTALLFAPRVAFAFPVAQARLDGEPWSYFDDSHVYLPNQPGRFEIEVMTGPCRVPRLERTFARISRAFITGECLSFDAHLPVWTESIPDDFYFHASVRHPKHKLCCVAGAEIVRSNEEAAVVRFKPGRIALSFKKREAESAAERPLSVISPEATAESWLRQQALHGLKEHLAPYRVHELLLEDLSPEALSPFDVALWYPYYHDGPPKPGQTEKLQALRSFAANGGGLFLISSALHILPALLRLSLPEPQTWGFTNFYKDYTPSGLRPVDTQRQHPIFEGLTPDDSDASSYTLVNPDRWDVFKTVQWQDCSNLAQKGLLLATMTGRLAAEFGPDMPCLWEFPLGQGRIVAYALNLRRGHGTQDMWPASPNEIVFVQNAVHYLAGHPGPVRVAAVW